MNKYFDSEPKTQEDNLDELDTAVRDARGHWHDNHILEPDVADYYDCSPIVLPAPSKSKKRKKRPKKVPVNLPNAGITNNYITNNIFVFPDKEYIIEKLEKIDAKGNNQRDILQLIKEG